MKKQNCFFDSIQSLDENSYPVFAHRHYRNKMKIDLGVSRYYMSYHSHVACDEQLLQMLYAEGRTGKRLKMSFSDFKQYVLFHNENSFSPHVSFSSDMRGRKAKWEVLSHGEFRQGKKYRKNEAHCKKEKEPDYWFDSKFKRDKQKRNGGYGTGAKKACRKAANGAHRQWQKEMLRRENYDVMSKTNESYESFNDPWDWD